MQVGRLSEEYAIPERIDHTESSSRYKVKYVSIPHPASLLRKQKEVDYQLRVQNVIIDLRDLFSDAIVPF